MLKKFLLVIAVIIFGLVAGYFSRPIYNVAWSIWGSLDTAEAGKTGQDSTGQTGGGTVGSKPEYIAENQAVDAVKDFPFIKSLARVAELDGSSFDCSIEQKPSAQLPVWLVEVKQRHAGELPETMYVQVDAVSGAVLDAEKADFKISGIGLSLTRREVTDILGKAPKSKRGVEGATGLSIRTDSYKGLEVVYNSQSRVIRVTATSEDQVGPKGLKTGNSKEDFMQSFGQPYRAPANLLTYRPIDDKAVQLVVRLNGEDKVEEIVLEKSVGE